MRTLVADVVNTRLQQLTELLEVLGCQVFIKIDRGEDLCSVSLKAIDACFIDVSLANFPDLALIRDLASQRPVVLMGDREDLAFPALEAGVIDYLKKPYPVERLARSLAKISSFCKAQPAKRLLRFPAKAGDGTLMIDLVKTTHFTFEEHAVWAHAGGRFHTYWRSLLDAEEALSDTEFYKVQRNILVALDQIVGLRSSDQGRLQIRLQGGTEIEVSRGAGPKLKERLGIP